MLGKFRKQYEENLAPPFGRCCLKLKLTPDILTAISLVFSIAAGVAFWKEKWYWGVLLFILCGFFDMLDGATARVGGTANPFGGVLDHTVDRYAEFFAVLGMSMSGHLNSHWALFSLFGMMMASYVRAKAESIGGLKSLVGVGIAERQEKMIILFIGAILEAHFPNLHPVQWAVILVGILSHITAVQRLAASRKKILGNKENN